VPASIKDKKVFVAQKISAIQFGTAYFSFVTQNKTNFCVFYTLSNFGNRKIKKATLELLQKPVDNIRVVPDHIGFQ